MSHDDPNREERHTYDGGRGAIDAYREGMRQAVREANLPGGFPAGRGSDRSDPTLFDLMQRALDRVERAQRDHLARGGKLYIVPSIYPRGSTAGLRSDDPRVPPFNPEIEGDGS